VIGQRFESEFWDSTGRFRSACDSQTPTSFERGAILVRLSIRATPPCTLTQSRDPCFRGYATMRLSSGTSHKSNRKFST